MTSGAAPHHPVARVDLDEQREYWGNAASRLSDRKGRIRIAKGRVVDVLTLIDELAAYRAQTERTESA